MREKCVLTEEHQRAFLTMLLNLQCINQKYVFGLLKFVQFTLFNIYLFGLELLHCQLSLG